MNTRSLGVAPIVVAVCLSCLPEANARDLTFEDRVKAQEAIERVYYSHQIGATKAFEEAIPREVLEKKVRTYLTQSVALEKYWHTPVTAVMLQRELERMARGSRMPDRLRELYVALGNDPFLIQECLARSTLVDRLTRNFFAYDEVIHGEERRTAEALHRELVERRIDPYSEHPNRTVLKLVRVEHEEKNEARAEVETFQPDRRNDPAHLDLSPDEFERWQRMLPEEMDAIGQVADEREAFVIRVVLERKASELRVASFAVPKRGWQDWWRQIEGTLDEDSVEALAPTDDAFPSAVGQPHCEREFKSTVLGGSNGERSSATSSCVPDDTWDNGVLDDLPDPRNGHTAVWTGSLMIVWGGSMWSGIQNSGGRYDPATDGWTATSTVGAPSARGSHTAVWTGSLMVVWGGYGSSGNVNTGGRYDPATDSWTPTSSVDAPSARGSHTAVWTGSLMIVWGGYPGVNTGGRYDPATDSWTPTSIVGAPKKRQLHTAVWTGSVMVVWGGGSHSPYNNTGGRYDPATDRWKPTSIAGAPAARGFHTAVWTGSLMVIWGGRGQRPLNTGGRYDPATDSWTPTSTVDTPEKRYFHTTVWTGGVMVVWGGIGGGRISVDTGGRYDPATDSWTPTSTVGAPTGRSSHTAVWTGSLMVIWGGGLKNTGGRYDPTSDSWTPTSTGDAPTGRYLHAAMWTGSRMFIWGGGVVNTIPVNTGGLYDPATDSWTPTSTVGAPTARFNGTAVWTGSQIVIWGGNGSTGSIYFNDGGRYDPASESWTPTSIVGAPTGRYGHRAVWTGSLMIVWGGTGSSGDVNTGGRYDPLTDGWTPTSTLGAPTARVGHTAVWTGGVMVVWGGYPALNTGGCYDPATDTWTPTSTAGAPTGRSSHTAVWTGSLMVIWGGSGLNTGGRYDPATDSWTPTSTLGAPTGRAGHTAVWTGSLMVVWGGDTGYPTYFTNTGGGYDPATDTWAPTSTEGAPAGRFYHTAVWTGSLMIVWGGYYDLNTGGRYALGQSVDNDGDGYSECDGDCDDTDPNIYPGAVEICDGRDNNCDGANDEGCGGGPS